MKNPELYHRSVDFLVRAYLHGELDELDCAACAVGNLIAGNCGYRIIGRNLWEDALGRKVEPDWSLIGRITVTEQTKSTGYSPLELMRIESAFMEPMEETFPSKDDRNFAGLMLVIDVLDEIHDADVETSGASRKKFEKVPHCEVNEKSFG